ncbi:hypothetical protein M9H77_22258 [Catharanthus roseus]|uniref:Uncharacterized protein n=1 Tax=Catharanthus roseus TaxID=4058 RepID=A0ACC0APZ2_CATRO|nr:hypothetical protein M9H77_22258 [Catharanthus roseus]
MIYLFLLSHFFLTLYDDPMGLNRKIRFELVRNARPGQPDCYSYHSQLLVFISFFSPLLPRLCLCLFIFFLSLLRLAITAALLRLFSFYVVASLPLAFPIGETDGQGGEEIYYCTQQVVSEPRNDYNFLVLFNGAGDLSKIPDLRELLSSSDPASEGFPSLGRSLTNIKSIDVGKILFKVEIVSFLGLFLPNVFSAHFFLTPYDDPMGLNRKIRLELVRDVGPGRAGPTQAAL